MQEPDALIVAKEGEAPAYRGLAYVVFERLPLADFGNRIPQLAFEIVRPVGALERMARAVTLIPGTTEFGYEPSEVVQAEGIGTFQPENRHVAHAPADIVASLDDLQAACPNLERVAIVVAWFGSDLRAGSCEIKPGVEVLGKSTHPLVWSAAGLTRATAHLVSTVEGRPAFGTPSDVSVTHLIAELKARGLKVTLYPFVMMDIPAAVFQPGLRRLRRAAHQRAGRRRGRGDRELCGVGQQHDSFWWFDPWSVQGQCTDHHVFQQSGLLQCVRPCRDWRGTGAGGQHDLHQRRNGHRAALQRRCERRDLHQWRRRQLSAGQCGGGKRDRWAILVRRSVCGA
jgi:hypothetical protein